MSFWSAGDIKKLETLFRQGLSNKAIARALNRSSPAVVAHLSRLGLKRTSLREPVDYTLRLPRDLYDQVVETSSRLGMSKGYFCRTAIEAQIKTETEK